jgi:RNA polymerase II subunit A small phosphatase-like protein
LVLISRGLRYLPPKAKHHSNKKTLVLDLDETLVHSGFKQFHRKSDMVLKIEFEGRMHDVHVLVRPGVDEFLEKMSRHYELVIFTASLSKVKE